MNINVTILGKRWQLVRGRLPKDVDGYCDPPDKPGKCITIRKSLRGRREAEIVLHECLHAAFWNIDEETVTQVAEDISKVLWRLGYRRES